MRFSPTHLPAVAALLAGLLFGCGPESPDLSPTRGYILISVDTLRADRLGVYGHDRPTSPFIDSLAEQGVVFENAKVQFPGTLSSHMSMLTGLYPLEHGVYAPSGVLPNQVEPMQEVFQQLGYRTAGHSEGGYVHGSFGYPRGFDEWSDEAKKLDSDAERTFARGVEFLEGLGSDDKFLLFLHTYTVHDPYFPISPYDELYWEGPEPDVFPATGPNLAKVNRGQAEITPRDLEFFKSRYDASINYVDDVLKNFFASLETLGLRDQVTVILTSDHGEEFLDHGNLLHEQVYPETMRVPLIVLHPGLEVPRRIRQVVETVDFAPTFYDIAGIEDYPPTSGHSLVPLMVGAEPDVAEAWAFAEGIENKVVAFHQTEDHHFHMVLRRLIGKEQNASDWIGTSTRFNGLPGKTRFKAVSYGEPRTFTASIGDRVLASEEIVTDRWTVIEVEVSPEDRLKEIVLSVDNCTQAAPPDPRCLGFRLRDHPLPSIELYDLDADPGATVNLVSEEPSVVREMIQQIERFESRRRSLASSQDLDPELEERLKSLGYLQ